MFEGENFQGRRDFINGPAKLWDLDDLPFGADWGDRIRSLRVGPNATVTAWVREGFEGEYMRSGADRSHPKLLPAFSAGISSLQIACDSRQRGE